MGRELVVQLASAGAHVAMCDVFSDNMEVTQSLAAQANPSARIAAVRADVSNAADMDHFASVVQREFRTEHINLLFNNAGIGGGASFVAGDHATWDRTFNVCWGGVLNGCRSFLPMLLKSPWGHVINTSSINGIWSRLPGSPNNAYVTAKFAVRGFTESLVTDFAMHAPHLRASVVHPGHIGTPIIENSLRALVGDVPAQILADVRTRSNGYVDDAPMSAREATAEIIAAVERGDWRILVGDDAYEIDRRVRDKPEVIHEQAFVDALHADGILTVFDDRA
jgi:NAD(P)-dependent dehydrogenase (short-subunit alcohol dehydrogenase family)